ncbi:hypothetical protein BDR05DRAFT_627250 [Suillus weaverae]|nr:hypothetical protein BDR05DRAFT_627250 [Suillus weaverae]
MCPENYMQVRDSLVHLGLWTRQMSQALCSFSSIQTCLWGSTIFHTRPTFRSRVTFMVGVREKRRAFECFWTISALFQDNNYASLSTRRSILSHNILNLPQKLTNLATGSALDEARVRISVSSDPHEQRTELPPAAASLDLQASVRQTGLESLDLLSSLIKNGRRCHSWISLSEAGYEK